MCDIWRIIYLLTVDAKLSSAKRFTSRFLLSVGDDIPSSSEFLIACASGSIAKLYRRHDIGSPWCNPLFTLYGLDFSLFINMYLVASLYTSFTLCMNFSGNLNLCSVFHKY